MRNFLRILKTLFSTSDERHAFILGLCETLAVRRPVITLWDHYGDYILGEYHYYMAGRALGVLAWVGIAIGLIKIWR